MKKEKFRRLPTFREYCKVEKRLKESATSNIKVEVDWWQDCICTVLNQLRSVSSAEEGIIDWGLLVDYCRARLLVLGRDLPSYIEDIVLSTIKDLVLQNYGSALFSSDNITNSFKEAELGTRILVVSQISDEILHQVKVEAGLEAEPEPQVEDPKTVASVSLDSEYYCEDELPFENKTQLHNLNPNKNKVLGYKDYGDKVNETYCHLQMDHYNTVVEKCLKDLEPEQEAGVLDYDKLLKRAKKEIEEKDDDKCLYKFIAQLARKHMKNEQVSIEGIDTTDITFEKIEVLKAAQNLFIYNIVQDIKGRIRK